MNSTTTVFPENGEVKYVRIGIDPRLKLLLVAVRRALIILADALKEYYET